MKNVFTLTDLPTLYRGMSNLMNLTSPRVSMFKKFIVCFALLFISSLTFAQTGISSPTDCKVGCTSNDVQIQAAYLSDLAGTKLPANFICPAGGTAEVYLTLELTTKTPRQGVVIYLNVKKLNSNNTVGEKITTITECFGIVLNQPTNKVTFKNKFLWTCGTPIVLSDVFIGWGTGNTNFCTGTGFQCPATSSKCYSLPPGQYIPIETPVASEAKAALCSTELNGTTAIFDLTSLESTVKGGQNNVTVKWFKNLQLTEEITNPSSYMSGTADVYAKVANILDANAFSTAKVSLTVVLRPLALSISGNSICASDAGTGKIISTTSVSGVTYQLYDSGNNPIQSAKPGTGAALTWNNLNVANGYYVISTGATPTNCTSNSNTANVLSVANPIALLLTGSSICSSGLNSGTVSSTTSEAGLSYQLKNANGSVQAAQMGTGSGLIWNNLPAANGYYVVATGGSPTNCSSGDSNKVNVSLAANPTALILTGSSICTANPGTGTVKSSGSQLGVKYQLYDGSNGLVQGPKPGTGNALVWNELLAGSGYYVVGTADAAPYCVSSSSNAVQILSIDNPVAPSGSMLPISCTDKTFSVKVESPIKGYKYSITQEPNNNATFTPIIAGSDDVIFTGLTFGDGYVLSVENNSGCSSLPSSCGGLDLEIQTKSSELRMSSVLSETTVKAYPNPFDNKINFQLNIPRDTEGSLELINLLGQHVKTVHQGKFKEGSQTFEVEIATKESNTLIYVLKTGDKKITGKLIQNRR